MQPTLTKKVTSSEKPCTKITPHTEIETRYFVPAKLAEQLASRAPSAIIEQHYFRRSTLQQLISSLNLADLVDSIEGLTSGRIRKTQALAPASGSLIAPLYQLELKGRRQLLEGASKRPEVSLSISAKTFVDLQNEADGGTVVKQRHEIHGRIFRGGSATLVTAQLDRYVTTGAPPKPPPLYFNTIEIEVPDQRLIKLLKAGHHNFSFLKQCIDVATLAETLQDSFKNRSLARDGFTPKFCKAIEKLERAVGRNL